jgi:hypothetical protein
MKVYPFKAPWLLCVPLAVTLKTSAFFLIECVYVFCIILGINSDKFLNSINRLIFFVLETQCVI